MKKIKILTIVLGIILVTMIAFFGIYVPVQNRMENKVKGYSYTMNLKGSRNIRLKVDQSNKTTIKDSEGNEVENSENLTDDQIQEKGYSKEETPYNSEEVLNEKNYFNTKDIIEERLKKLAIEDYSVKVDKNTGDILVEIPENDDTDTVVSNLATVGKFEIIDKQTKEVLMDNHDIKLANVMYGSGNSKTTASSSGTTVYLNIEFTKEGTKKLEDISNQYVKTDTTQTTENAETEDTTNNKEISMMMDDKEIMSTSFDETIKTGKLQLSVGKATTENSTLQGYVSQASNMAVVLDTGKMPVQYQVEADQYILSDITNQELNRIIYITLGVVFILLVVLIVKYRFLGLLGAVSYMGLFSALFLLIRYTNVALSIQAILGIIILLILNYILVNKLLFNLKTEKLEKMTTNQRLKDTYQEFFLKIIPICIATIVFCFAKWAPISSFGMVMFWGIVLIAIYNLVITNALLKIRISK